MRFASSWIGSKTFRVAGAVALVVGSTVVWMACEDDPQSPGGGVPAPDSTLELYVAYPNLAFSRPVDVQNAGDGTDRIFVVEQDGIIRVFPNTPAAATTTEFLNIAGPVTCCGELGLLGLAFHPDYETNGYFYVYYTTAAGGLRERLSRFERSAADPNVADPASEKILLEMPDREGNHNGGAICFDDDGYLYVATGDEGGAGDPYGNAQNRSVLFGKILRLDVDQNVDTTPYHGIPADNPYVGNSNGWREEIYAYGLRNPWRISYDVETDRVWIGDVGQGTYEEIDILASGANYGWDCREGRHDYTGPPGAPSASCLTAFGLVDPVWEYTHALGISITGGYVYRGTSAPELVGRYIYADYSTSHVWALAYGGGPTDNDYLFDMPETVSSFGVSETRELLICGYNTAGTSTQIYGIREAEVHP